MPSLRFSFAFLLAACSSPDASDGPGETSSPTCQLRESMHWTTPSTPLIAPPSDATHALTAIKDPSIVRYNDLWYLYASSVSTAGAYNMVHTTFSDFSEAPSATFYYMDKTPGFNTYVAAPELFYFRPGNEWYLVFQSGPPMYSTTGDPGNPATWTVPKPFFASEPAIITQNGGWLDFWVICDDASCYLFNSDNHGRWYRSKTSIADFPNGFGDPVVAIEDTNAGRVFEASNVYKIEGSNQYLAIIEAFDQTSNNQRYFRSWIADSLEGEWLPWQASGSYPFASARNVTFEGGEGWTADISHGEMIRSGYDETLAANLCGLRYLFQGTDPNAETGGDYNKIPWHLGLLTEAD